MESNSTLQADEVQALSAIYGNDWKTEDEEHHIYSITIQENCKDKTVYLQVTMPPEYPQDSPPLYEISAPWLKGIQRMNMSSLLEDIYCENVGESIIFLWIEKIREYVANQENLQKELQADIKELAIETVEEPSYSSYDQIPIYHGEPITHKKSTFQAHLAPVVAKDQISQVLSNLLGNRKIAGATHNIHAYRICDSDSDVVYQDCDDDGEAQAGIRLLHLLQLLHVKNVLVVVSRWFGGILLGPERFKCINNVARDILSAYGYIGLLSTSQEDSKNEPKGKKKKGK